MCTVSTLASDLTSFFCHQHSMLWAPGSCAVIRSRFLLSERMHHDNEHNFIKNSSRKKYRLLRSKANKQTKCQCACVIMSHGTKKALTNPKCVVSQRVARPTMALLSRQCIFELVSNDKIAACWHQKTLYCLAFYTNIYCVHHPPEPMAWPFDIV